MPPFFPGTARLAPTLPRLALTAAAGGILLVRRNCTVPKAVSCAEPVLISDTYKPFQAVDAVTSASPPDSTNFPCLLVSVAILQSIWCLVTSRASMLSAWVAQTLPMLQYADAQATAMKPSIDVGAVQQFCGCWVKETSRSDSMDAFCQLFGVPRWLRQATRLMVGLEICMQDNALLVKQVCKLRWLSTMESFPLDGVPSSLQRRRDLRPGKQRGQLLVAADDYMQIRVVWEGAPCGEARDTLQLAKSGKELLVLHEANLHDRGQAAFKEVYKRKAS